MMPIASALLVTLLLVTTLSGCAVGGGAAAPGARVGAQVPLLVDDVRIIPLLPSGARVVRSVSPSTTTREPGVGAVF